MTTNAQFEERFLTFSADVLALVCRLPKSQTGRHIADQLMRSGTSVGAQMREARAAESRADLIHKMQIALKEAREASYWLLLLRKAGIISDRSLDGLVQESNEITAILAKSVITAKKNNEEYTHSK